MANFHENVRYSDDCHGEMQAGDQDDNHELSIDPTPNASEKGFPNFIMWIHSLVDTILPISTFRWIITFCNSLDKFFGQNNPFNIYLVFAESPPAKHVFWSQRVLSEKMLDYIFSEMLSLFVMF